MQKSLVLILTLLISISLSAQVGKTDKKASKNAKKEQRKREEAIQAAILDSVLVSQQFVLEAEYLANPSGKRMMVDNNLNFIGIDKENAAYQFAAAKDVEVTDIGTLTVDGTASNFVETRNKKGSHIVKFRISSRSGQNISVEMYISPVGNTNATVKKNSATILRVTGNIVALRLSHAYKGRSIYSK